MLKQELLIYVISFEYTFKNNKGLTLLNVLFYQNENKM